MTRIAKYTKLYTYIVNLYALPTLWLNRPRSGSCGHRQNTRERYSVPSQAQIRNGNSILISFLSQVALPAMGIVSHLDFNQNETRMGAWDRGGQL